MTFTYACEIYKGFSLPESKKGIDAKDWHFLSKAKSLENAIKKAKSTKNGRWIRVYKLDENGGHDYSYANEFQYFVDGVRYYDYDVPDTIGHIKHAYTNRYKKFVDQNSTALPEYVVHYLTNNFYNFTGVDDYFDFDKPIENALYVGNYFADFEEIAAESYHRYYYNIGINDIRTYYIRESRYIRECNKSDIYKSFLSSFVTNIYNACGHNLLKTEDVLTNTDHAINSVLSSKKIFVLRDKLLELVSYFFKLAEANKDDKFLGYETYLELANDFRSCLPDFFEKVNKVEKSIQEEITKYKEHIEDEPIESE
jgi:hypothetical protein